MLDDPLDLAGACLQAWRPFQRGSSAPKTFEAGDLYCGRCGGPRRVRINVFYSWVRQGNGSLTPPQGDEEADRRRAIEELVPTLLLASCLQCGSRFSFVVHLSPTGPAVVVLPQHYGGLSTPHTPPEVAYYLDQAQRAQSVGAFSAAVAMYRSALEQFLHEQGFDARMVGPKLGQLEKAIEEGSAPKWALELDPDFMSVINALGAGSLHANEGDINLQAELDVDLLRLLGETFDELLTVVYEREHTRRERLKELRAAAAVFERKHPSA
jgi:hypothetical protein